MKQVFTLIFLLLTISVLGQTGLPILDIHTINGEEPQCEFVFAPENAFGISITNVTKVPGRSVLIMQGDTIFDSGEYEKDRHGMTIKIRGNTSAYYSVKKPYKIKLEKKNDMLGRGDSTYYDKNWILIDDGGDMLNTMIGLKINELLGLGKWTPTYMFVNLYINDDYRGIYMLLESVKRNADCRINVDKQTGYIIECDAYWWNENVWFNTESEKKYTFKYPDDKDVTNEQISYIQQTLNTMEHSIVEGTYNDYIDVYSFAAWMMAHDILGTYDSGGANVYLTKYDNTPDSKLTMATLWDFGSIMKTNNEWSRIRTDDFFYFNQLFENKNSEFLNAYITIWNQKSEDIFEGIKTFLNDFASSQTAIAIQESRPYDGQRWGYPVSTVNENIQDALTWFTQRQKWINGQLLPNKINTPNLTTNSKGNTFHINGQKNNNPKFGIYIVDGKKRFIK